MNNMSRTALLGVLLCCAGCESVPIAAPDLPDAILVPGSNDCHLVVRDDRAIWWTSESSSDLKKVDPMTHETLARIRMPVSYALEDIATGFGAVWIASGGSRPTICKVDARENRVEAEIELASFWGRKGKRAYIAVGEGAVWATTNVLDTLFRIDPDTGSRTASIAIGPIPLSDYPGRLAAGEGAVWVLHNRTVTRVDPNTERVTARITVPGVGFGVGEIMAGGGSVWVAASSNLIRIDPRTNTVVATIAISTDPDVRSNLFAIGHMVIANGTLWALAFQSLGSSWEPTAVRYSLLEIDMDTNSVRSTRQLGTGDATRLFFGPTLAATDDAIWICQPTGLYVVPLSPVR